MDKNTEVLETKEISFEKKVEGWKKEYGDVYLIEADFGLFDPDSDESKELEDAKFVFRKPERAHLSRLAKGAMTNTLNAVTNLVFDCLLYPDSAKVKKLFEDKPGLAISLGSELQKTVGMGQDFFRKKL
ncbi:MAG: hypothetical protein JJT76_12865 [Clostridiaceae bacterium]|nr:hypothetical protein [Clostridiaceae bacterium]